MLHCLDVVWRPCVEKNRITFLLLDECRTHMTEEVRRAFEACRMEIDFIPGNFTNKLQPLDVGVNKPFKD